MLDGGDKGSLLCQLIASVQVSLYDLVYAREEVRWMFRRRLLPKERNSTTRRPQCTGTSRPTVLQREYVGDS